MDDPEEFIGSNNNDHQNHQRNQIIHHVKGKRTKRPRSSLSSSPNCGGVAITSSSSSGGACGGDGRGRGGDDFVSISSPTSSTTTASEEEEDMANCLILLAQGDSPKQIVNHDHEDDGEEDRHQINCKSNIIIHRAKANNLFVYECKTCNRTFPSFQALGGHRASHKKPKSIVTAAPGPTPAAATTTEEIVKRVPICMPKGEVGEAVVAPNKGATSTNLVLDGNNNKGTTSTNLVLHGNNNKGTKIHECSICGLEFMSGQALGGHMRRHRAAAATNIVRSGPTMDTEIKRTRNILQLDLNLPAPEDELSSRESNKFQLITSSQQQSIVFSSTPTLVDCYY